jgi:hypothetical protein
MIKQGSPLATAILTATRADYPVEQLQVMEFFGDPTPVSGDALTRIPPLVSRR